MDDNISLVNRYSNQQEVVRVKITDYKVVTFRGFK